MSNKNDNINEQIEEVLSLAREEKLNELELLKQSIEEKNKTIEENKQTIKQLEEKNKDLYKQILSLKAEFDNFRKRTEKEKQKKFLLGKIDVIEKIISLYEMFSYAINSLEEKNKNYSQIFEGIKILYKEFENFFIKEGVKKIECLNMQFDHNYHEVVDFQEDPTKQDGIIVEVVSNGYTISWNGEEYILRPAKVKVVRNKKEEDLVTENQEKSSNYDDKNDS